MKNQGIISGFKNYLERLGYQKNTCQMLPSCIKEFLEKKNEPLTEITPAHILDHYEYLTSRPNKRRPGGLSEMMVSHHIYALRVFFGWQEQLGRIRDNPVSGLNFPRPKYANRQVLTLAEVNGLYESCDTLQQKAVLGLCYGCGLRRSETAALDIKDIHFKSLLLYVRKGKGAKRRAVPINEKVAKDLKDYLYKERYGKPGEPAFITNTKGKRISGSKLNDILKELAIKANIKKEISLHHLRHSIATHLLESGMSVEHVREFLGHKHLESTQVYTRISKQQLQQL